MQTRVLLVDDHVLLRKGLHLLLDDEPDLQVVGEAENGEMAVQLAGELTPDVVIMDITMPGLNGIEATRQILASQPDTRILALSIHRDQQFVEDMLAAGAAGYLLKESVPEELIAGIRAVRRGEVYLSAAITEVVVLGYRELLESEGAAGSSRKKAGTGPLLKTKLYCPSLSPGLVQRSRLVAYLDHNFQRPLTLIAAPAGYGKSVLASSWVQSSNHPFAWISLDENDNDLRTFLAYLVAAVQRPFPEALPDTALLLDAASLPAVPVLARTLINELDRIPERFVLVWDDYHHIDAAAIHEFLGELLRHPLENLHLLLLTRADPPFDLLNLQARQQMGILRAQALSFTTEETAAFLEQKMGAVVDEGVVKALGEKTEGWITGLILMTLSVRDSARLANLSTTLPGELQTLDFLAAEALAHQPHDVQASLLKTSILNRFCAPLCEVICTSAENQDTLISDGEGFIRWLTDSNLFVIPLDDHGQWFRYHHLFQELLQSQLESVLEADEIAELHIRASHWFAENGLTDEAIQHALAAGDAVSAAEIIEQRRHIEHETGNWYRVEKWLAMLPDEIKEKRPGLILAQAWVAFIRFQLDQIPPMIAQIEMLLNDQDADVGLLGELNFFHGNLAYWAGEAETSIRYLEEALTQFAGKESHIDGTIELMLGLAWQMIGQAERAIQALNQRIWDTDSSEVFLRAYLIATLAFIYTLSSDLKQARLQAQGMQAQAGTLGNFNIDAWRAYLLACVDLHTCQLADAAQQFELAAEQRYTLDTGAVIDALAGLALAQQLQGQTSEANQTLDQLLELASELNDPQGLSVAHSCRARLSLLRNELGPAMQWASSDHPTPAPAALFLWLEVSAITQARVLIVAGSKDSLLKATEILHKIRHQSEAHFFRNQTIEVAVLQSLALEKQGHANEATLALEDALSLALPGGWVRPFVELGEPMAALLKRLNLQVGADELGHFIDTILAAFPSTPAAPVHSRGTDQINPLTDRELQVMRFLASSLSAGEIADELVVSVNTVRMHTKNIYSKLDAHSRIEAVEIAREMGLI